MSREWRGRRVIAAHAPMAEIRDYGVHESALQAMAEASMPVNGRRKRFRELAKHTIETGDEPLGYRREIDRASEIISRLYLMGFRIEKRRRRKEDN